MWTIINYFNDIWRSYCRIELSKLYSGERLAEERIGETGLLEPSLA